ncbi:MAG: GNAT family N-acetyltransferase [Ruminococcaceae bacterium]|nr:GNAT family N-acetyltransferase [Oscillospiraceae bacterium]
MTDIKIRALEDDDFEEASRMIFHTFYKYIMPTYTTEGIEFFRDTTSAMSFKMNTFDGSIVLWGAFDGDVLCGVLGSRGTNHICLFFTHKDYMGKGVGKKLFSHFLSLADKSDKITVNASDYGIPIYEKLGFEVVGERYEDHGTVHTPMEYRRAE